MRLTVVGCSGSLPGPGVRRVLLPRRPSTTAAPGASCSTSATARSAPLQRSRRPRRRRRRAAQPPARRPLRRPVRPLRRPPLPTRAGPLPARARATARRAPPSGWPAPTAWTTAEQHGRRVRLPRVAGPGRVRRSARSRSRRSRSNHPVEAYGLRVEAGGRVAGLHRRHRQLRRRSSPLCRDADLVLAEAAFVDGRDAAEDLHLTGRRAAEAAARRRGVRRLVLTHLPPWNDPRGLPGRRPARSGPAPRRAGRARRDLRRCEPLRPAPVAAPPSLGAHDPHRRPRPRPAPRRDASPAAGWTTPRAACSSSSAGPGCCAPRRSPRACRAGARAAG